MPKKTPAPSMKPHTGKIQFIPSPKTSMRMSKPQAKADKVLQNRLLRVQNREAKIKAFMGLK